MNMDVTWQTVLAIAGGIILLGNLGKMIVSWMNPFKKLAARVKGCEEKLANDHIRINREQEDTKMILQCLFVTLQHLRTGNETGLMDRSLQTLQEHLANRA